MDALRTRLSLILSSQKKRSIKSRCNTGVSIQCNPDRKVETKNTYAADKYNVVHNYYGQYRVCLQVCAKEPCLSSYGSTAASCHNAPCVSQCRIEGQKRFFVSLQCQINPLINHMLFDDKAMVTKNFSLMVTSNAL